MVLLENATSTVGFFISNATTNVTGDKSLTLFAFVLLIIVFGFMFRLGIEWILLLLIPLLILFTYMSPYGGVILLLTFIFFAVWMVKVIVQYFMS